MLSHPRSRFAFALFFVCSATVRLANAQSTEGYFDAQKLLSKATAALEAKQLVEPLFARIRADVEAESTELGRAVAEYQRIQNSLTASDKARTETELRTRQERFEASVRETEQALTTWQNSILQWVFDELRKIIEQLRIELGLSAIKDVADISGEPKGRDVTESIVTRMNSNVPHLPAGLRDLPAPSFPRPARPAAATQQLPPSPATPSAAASGGACKGEEHFYGEVQRMLYMIRTNSAEGVDLTGYWKEPTSHYAMRLNPGGTGIFNVDMPNVYVNVEWYILGECDGTIKSLSPRPGVKAYVLMMKATGHHPSLTNYPNGTLISKVVHNARGYWSADGMFHQ